MFLDKADMLTLYRFPAIHPVLLPDSTACPTTRTNSPGPPFRTFHLTMISFCVCVSLGLQSLPTQKTPSSTSRSSSRHGRSSQRKTPVHYSTISKAPRITAHHLHKILFLRLNP